MDFISGAIDHLDVSGFEALEILDVRSRLASREPLLDEPDRARLEGLDRQLLQMADSLMHVSQKLRIWQKCGEKHMFFHLIGGGISMGLVLTNARLPRDSSAMQN